MDEIAWRPGIGDPTFVGWLTVVVYFVNCWLCLRAFMVEKRGPPRPYREAIPALLRVVNKHRRELPLPARRALLWFLFAVLLLMMGINKQLDLQSLLTDIGRIIAYENGWYERRRELQSAFISVLLVGGVCGMVAVWWLVKDAVRDFRLALAGLLAVVVFVLVRAASFHDVDILIKTEFLGMRLNGVFELGGLGVVMYAAATRIREAGRPVFKSWRDDAAPPKAAGRKTSASGSKKKSGKGRGPKQAPAASVGKVTQLPRRE